MCESAHMGYWHTHAIHRHRHTRYHGVLIHILNGCFMWKNVLEFEFYVTSNAEKREKCEYRRYSKKKGWRKNATTLYTKDTWQ